MSTLTSDQSKVLESIRYFCNRYESAFPSITKIAQMAGMCTRKAADHIKELVQLGRIRKEQRWENGRQLSNRYEIIEQQPEKKECADYKRSYKSSKRAYNLKHEDDDKYIAYRKREYFSMAEEKGIPEEVAVELLPYIEKHIRSVSWVALRGAFIKLKNLASTVGHIPSWFAEVLRNEDLAQKLEFSQVKTRPAAARI